MREEEGDNVREGGMDALLLCRLKKPAVICLWAGGGREGSLNRRAEVVRDEGPRGEDVGRP